MICRKRPTGILLTCGFLSMAVGWGSGAAQVPQGPLDRVSRLEVVNVPLDVALRTLRRSSGVAMAYSPDLLPQNLRVTCRCRSLTVGQALDRLLHGTDLEYRAGRRQVLIGRELETRDAEPGAGQWEAALGTLEVLVLTSPDNLPLAEALITITGPMASPDDPGLPPSEAAFFHTDADGRFSGLLAPGEYHVVAEAPGTEERSDADIVIRIDQITRITIHLPVLPFQLDEIVVAPSTFGMMRTRGPSGQTLSREELEAQPHPGNDIIRAVERLPGISTTDYSAKPFVRGARAEEVLTVLDGVELFEPYHIKYWDGSLSIVDMETVSEVELTTGGFTTEYGDKSAGVLTLLSTNPATGPPRTTFGLDFMSSIAKTEGTFHDGKGAWLASARRGFLAFVFDLMNLYPDEDLRPSYYDVFSKVRYELRPGHRLSARFLHGGDDSHGVEVDSTVYRVQYGNSYGWMTWEAQLGRNLSARTIASVARVSSDREGTDYWEPGDPPILRVDDESTTWYSGLRQDWQLRHSPRLLLKWGFDLRRGKADYDYSRSKFSWIPNLTDPDGPDWWPGHDTVTVALSRLGTQVGGYLASRFRIAEGLTAETGLRYDRQSHTGEQQVSPRIQMALQLSPRTTLRGAWGRYHQSHALHEMWAADGDTIFYPAQRAEHRILGLEHQFWHGHSLRVEAYQRQLDDPLPEYRRVARNNGALWEEALADRVFVHPELARAKGIELFVKSPGEGPFSWSGSYTLAKTEEKVAGQWVPRPYDQRHAINLQLAYRPTAEWTFAAGWSYHSPWPYTEVNFELAQTVHGNVTFSRHPSTLNQERLTPYKRTDFRASRRFRLGSGDLLLYVDVFNLFNQENALDQEQSAYWSNGRLNTSQSLYPQLGIMPSIGLKWTF